MNVLDHAIAKAGGVTKLAKALGLRQNRISNWRIRGGVPDGWLTVLQLLYPQQHAPDLDTKGSIATKSIANDAASS